MRAIVAVTVALILVFLLAACGDGAAGPTPAPATTSPSSTAQPPERDHFDLARRYLGLPPDAPRVARSEPFAYEVGDSETFSLLDLDAPSTYEVTATVRAITDHAYFFLQDGTSYSDSSLQEIAADFEGEVWPKVTAAFGEPWTPGVDGDPRITVLHAALRGAGGYVSGTDSLPRAVAPTSNEREMLYIERSVLSTPGVEYNDVVAHELQHLIHAHADDSEESWVNEGLSQVAGQSVGGGEVWIPQFLAQPDLQLDHWPSNGDSIPNYAASELFFAHLLDHYGGRANGHALLNEPGDGWGGIDAYLAAYGTKSEDVFAGWVIANWLDAEDGRYSHPSLNAKTTVAATVTGDGNGTVRQYAADYLRIPAGSGTVFGFQGEETVSIGIPERDGAFWWSQRGDAIDSRLTRELDLRTVDTASLRFDAWYDIERGWDYAYVAASTDGGATWQTLPGQHTTSDNPTGASYGYGYTGASGGWIAEEIDLSEFAGRQILLRFENVTDDSANRAGFAVDNIAVPEIGLEDGAETATGWQAEGFRRITGPLEQQWLVQAIYGDGQVYAISVGEDGSGGLLFDDARETVIVIAAITRGTAEPAAYSWTLSP